MRIRVLATCLAWACAVAYASAQEGDAAMRLSLRQALAIAHEKSPRLRASDADVAAARAESRAARANTLPQLGVHGFAARSSMPMIATSAPGVMPANTQMLPEGRYTDVNLMLMAPLYTGGALGGRPQAAAAQARFAEAMQREAVADVVLSVTEAYLGALAAAEMEAAEASRVAAMEETVRLAQGRFEVGRDVEASVRRAEAELAEARQMLVIARSDRQKLVLDLLAQMGDKLNVDPVLTDRLVFAPPTMDLSGYVEMALRGRGETQAAEAGVEQARAILSASRGAAGPQLYGFAMGDSFQSSEMGDDSGTSVGVVASFPLFDGGMRRAEIDRAAAMLKRAQAERAETALRIEREVRQAWIDVLAAHENYATATSALKAAEAAYEVARLRYESGRAILVEQLDALASVTRARANLARALFGHQIAVARLERASGITTLENPGDHK